MSFLKGKLGRSAVVVAFSLGAFQALSIVGALPASAATTCVVSGGAVTVATGDAGQDFTVYQDLNGVIHVAANVAGSGAAALEDGTQDIATCSGGQANVATATAINVTGASGVFAFDQTVWIEMSKVDTTAAPFIPTTTLANWGKVNWVVSLGSNDAAGDSLAVVDSTDTLTPMNVTAGANGIDLNSDGDLDVTVSGVEVFYFDSASDGNVVGGASVGNNIDLNGSTITGGPFTSGALLGWSPGTTDAGFDGDNLIVTNFLLWTTTGDNTVYGGSGDDNIASGMGDDTVGPGLGNDTIDDNGNACAVTNFGFFGDCQDTLDYSNTTTAINVNLPGDTISQGTNIDTLTAAGIEDVVGTSAGDTILGDAAANWIMPGAGNDSVDGGTAGEDTYDVSDSTAGVTVDLGAGTSTGGSGSDTLARIDDVFGSGSNDSLTGSAGDNVLWGWNGNDTLSGGAGDGDGADTFDGGSGIDTLDYGNNTLSTTADLTDVAASGIAGEGDDVEANTIENAILGSGDDLFVGTAFNNIVWPNGGQNALLGGVGGIDTVNYSMGYTAGVTVNLTGGGAAGGNQDSITGFTNAVGTAFNDTLLGTDVVVGTNGANLLVGGKGNDVISANAGPDLVRAGAGNDNIRAGQGDDSVWGQGGNDNVRGGQGDDNIIGGKGRDTCYGGGGHDVVHCEKGHKAARIRHARLAHIARI